MPDHGVDELPRARFQAIAGSVAQRLDARSSWVVRLWGARDARLEIVQARKAPDQVRVAVYKTGHYDMPGGVDFLGSMQEREVLDAPAETHFDDAPVLNEERAIANDREFLESGPAPGFRRTAQRNQLPRPPYQ